MRPEFIIIHESESPFATPAMIDSWHATRGFRRKASDVGIGELPSIGYQYVITNGRTTSSKSYELTEDGRIYTGRHEHEHGAHDPSMNAQSIGICLVGKDGKYTEHQIDTLLLLVSSLLRRYAIDVAKVLGHYETPTQRGLPRGDRKRCPSIDMDVLRGRIRRVHSAIEGALESP